MAARRQPSFRLPDEYYRPRWAKYIQLIVATDGVQMKNSYNSLLRQPLPLPSSTSLPNLSYSWKREVKDQHTRLLPAARWNYLDAGAGGAVA